MSTNNWEDDFLNHIDEELRAIPQEQPSGAARKRFLDFVESEGESVTIDKPKENVFMLRQWLPQIGVAAALLVIFGTIMYQQNLQNHQLNDNLVAMNRKVEQLLQNDSPTERIKAITVGYEPDGDVNDRMLETLFGVLKNDESSNVRQTAVETLAFYIENDKVRSGLIQALPKEKDAIVKLSIIQAIAMKKDDKSKNALEDFIKSNTNEPFVVDEANMQLTSFKQY